MPRIATAAVDNNKHGSAGKVYSVIIRKSGFTGHDVSLSLSSACDPIYAAQNTTLSDCVGSLAMWV